jgi:hypothetical protein
MGKRPGVYVVGLFCAGLTIAGCADTGKKPLYNPSPTVSKNTGNTSPGFATQTRTPAPPTSSDAIGKTTGSSTTTGWDRNSNVQQTAAPGAAASTTAAPGAAASTTAAPGAAASTTAAPGAAASTTAALSIGMDAAGGAKPSPPPASAINTNPAADPLASPSPRMDGVGTTNTSRMGSWGNEVHNVSGAPREMLPPPPSSSASNAGAAALPSDSATSIPVGPGAPPPTTINAAPPTLPPLPTAEPSSAPLTKTTAATPNP